MKRFFFCLLSCIVLALAGLAYVNWNRDPMGILKGDFSSVRLEPDQHFVKMRYILAHPDLHDSFAFGSSRVAKIDLTRIPEGNWYNMSYSEGMPDEWLDDLRRMLQNGVKIRHLLIGLDDGSFRLPPHAHTGKMDFRRPYRPYDAEFYLNELFQKPQRVDEELLSLHGALYDIYGTGRSFAPEAVEQFIDTHLEEHAQSDRLFLSSAYIGSNIPYAIDILQQIKELADAIDIELTVFFNPVWHTTYADNDLQELADFKRQLANVTDYYDFSGFNKVTTNPADFYESSHYRPKVGDMLVDRMFLNGAEQSSDFGILVTASNVQEHLQRLAAQVVSWEAAHPQFHEETAFRRQFTKVLPERFLHLAKTDARLYCQIDNVTSPRVADRVLWTQGSPIGLRGWMVAGTGQPIEAAAILKRTDAADGQRFYLRVKTLHPVKDASKWSFELETPKGNVPAGTYTLSLLVRTDKNEELVSDKLLTLQVIAP